MSLGARSDRRAWWPLRCGVAACWRLRRLRVGPSGPGVLAVRRPRGPFPHSSQVWCLSSSTTASGRLSWHPARLRHSSGSTSKGTASSWPRLAAMAHTSWVRTAMCLPSTFAHGRSIGQIDLGFDIRQPPALLPDRLIVLGVHGTISCIEPRTGAVMWTVETRDRVTGASVVLGRSVVIASVDGHVRRYELGSGRLVGETALGDQVYTSMCVRGLSAVVAGRAHLSVVDLRDWATAQYALPNAMRAAAPVLLGTRVFGADLTTGAIWSSDAETGAFSEIARLEQDGSRTGSLPLTAGSSLPRTAACSLAWGPNERRAFATEPLPSAGFGRQRRSGRALQGRGHAD